MPLWAQCTHGLDVAYGDGTAVLLAVAMLQLAFQGNGDNLHILMRMGSEAFSRSYPVVVQNAQRAEIHAAGVVILVKTECLNEMIDMRMKTILFERQSELLVGKPRRKIVTNVGLQYFYFPTSSTRAENRLQNSRNKRKRTKIASDNLLSYVTICLNGDCLSRNAERLWGLPPEYPI